MLDDPSLYLSRTNVNHYRSTNNALSIYHSDKHTLDIDYPIREIHVSSRDAVSEPHTCCSNNLLMCHRTQRIQVEGIEVIYSVANNVGTTTISHGSRFAETDKVTISGTFASGVSHIPTTLIMSLSSN